MTNNPVLHFQAQMLYNLAKDTFVQPNLHSVQNIHKFNTGTLRAELSFDL